MPSPIDRHLSRVVVRSVAAIAASTGDERGAEHDCDSANDGPYALARHERALDDGDALADPHRADDATHNSDDGAGHAVTVSNTTFTTLSAARSWGWSFQAEPPGEAAQGTVLEHTHGSRRLAHDDAYLFGVEAGHDAE